MLPPTCVEKKPQVQRRGGRRWRKAPTSLGAHRLRHASPALTDRLPCTPMRHVGVTRSARDTPPRHTPSTHRCRHTCALCVTGRRTKVQRTGPGPLGADILGGVVTAKQRGWSCDMTHTLHLAHTDTPPRTLGEHLPALCLEPFSY